MEAEIMVVTTVNIARDFSDTPGGRHRRLGPSSGEEFRDRLVALLEKGQNVEIILDGTEGYGSSFLEEAFGGLVRLRKWNATELIERIKFVASDPAYKFYAEQAVRYMREAAARQDA